MRGFVARNKDDIRIGQESFSEILIYFTFSITIGTPLRKAQTLHNDIDE